MALIQFKNLPDTTTPINAENLNNNFDECYISASGTSSDGYIKYPNGKAICYGNVSVTGVPSGSSKDANVTLPISFINAYYPVMVTKTNSGGYWASTSHETAQKTTTGFKINSWNNASEETGTIVYEWVAIGNWK